MNIRTDLALEGIKTANVKSGIKEYKRGRSFKVTEIIIDNDNYLQTIGKGKGRYITLECSRLSKFSDEYEDMAQELASELKQLIPEGEALVVGLGNNDITPDALGPQTAAKVLATRA